MASTNLVNVDQLTLAMQKVRTTYDTKISAVYKPKGTVAFSSLTAELLIAANLGNIYNIADAFTTTELFIEGAGKKHSAGSNVAIVEATPTTYKATTDTSAQDGKTYYSNATGTLAFPAPETGDDISDKGYYEVDVAATYKFDVMPGDMSNFQELAVPARAGNVAILNENGQSEDSTVGLATNAEVNAMLNITFA